MLNKNITFYCRNVSTLYSSYYQFSVGVRIEIDLE